MFCFISLPCLVLYLRGASSDLRIWKKQPVTTGILTRRNQKKPEGWKLRSVRPSFPACEVRTSPWAPQEQFMTKIGQAAQSTGWIISSQSRDQAVQSTGWIISVQSQFFRSCFLRTSPWGCWGPLTYRWWSGSGSTLGSCPAVSWGSLENQQCTSFPEMGGYKLQQANQVTCILLQAMQCRDDLLQSLQCRDVRLQFILCRDVLLQALLCRDVRLQSLLCRDVRLQSLCAEMSAFSSC